MFYHHVAVVGVVRGWKVVPVPSSWTKSNLSAFVLPERVPVADDGKQLPMFEGDELVRDLLKDALKTVRVQAKALKKATAALDRIDRQRRDGEAAKARRPHLPQNKELREWHTFCAYFQNLERIVRRENHLKPDDEVTREVLYAAGAPSPKTITRIMVETHGLTPDQWPPSTWPADSPRR